VKYHLQYQLEPDDFPLVLISDKGKRIPVVSLVNIKCKIISSLPINVSTRLHPTPDTISSNPSSLFILRQSMVRNLR
jgi:hypothetical protein